MRWAGTGTGTQLCVLRMPPGAGPSDQPVCLTGLAYGHLDSLITEILGLLERQSPCTSLSSQEQHS